MDSLRGVNVGVGVRISASAVKVVARVGVAVQVAEVSEDSAVTGGRVGAEPCRVASGRRGVAVGVRVRRGSVGLGCGGSTD